MTKMGIGFEAGRPRFLRTLTRALAASMWLLPTGCGDYVSWNERWPFDTDDGHDGHSSTPPSDAEPAPIPACDAAPIENYGYAEPPDFWLGTQATFDLRVDGPGYLLAGTAGGDASELSYLRVGALSVAPDGNIELGGEPALGYPLDATLGGEPALGYPLDATPEGSCLGQLRAPNLAPPEATSSIEIGMNLDPRGPVVPFDVLEPNGTSNTSLSMTVFDSTGALHYVDIYFSNLGAMAYEYHVMIDGADLVGGTPGEYILVSTGRLQFDSSGALSSAMTPPFEVSFTGGAEPGQRIELRYGPDMASGVFGVSSTSFPSGDAVFSLAVSGLAEGTSSGIDVRPNGDVLVYYDNGEARSIGTLALARFPREAALAPSGGGWGMTAESGPPQHAIPQSPGRGMIVVESVSAWP